MIFSLANEALIPKCDKLKLFHKIKKEKTLINKKSVKTDENLQNEIFLILFEKEDEIAKKRQRNEFLNSNTEDYIKQNLDVKNNYTRFILNRKVRRNIDNQRISYVNAKKSNLLINKLLYKTLLLHKWDLRKKQVVLIRMI